MEIIQGISGYLKPNIQILDGEYPGDIPWMENMLRITAKIFLSPKVNSTPKPKIGNFSNPPPPPPPIFAYYLGR